MKSQNIWKLLVVILMITTTAFGQQRTGGQRGGQQGPPQTPSEKQIEKMVSNLSKEIMLSEEQETEVLALYKNHFEDVEDLTKSGRPDRDKMEELKEDFEAKVKDVLTEDQEKSYEAYLKKNARKGPKRRG